MKTSYRTSVRTIQEWPSSSGGAIDVRDAMQAGICLETGMTLVTRNVSHFERVPGLQLSHPVELI